MIRQEALIIDIHDDITENVVGSVALVTKIEADVYLEYEPVNVFETFMQANRPIFRATKVILHK